MTFTKYSIFIDHKILMCKGHSVYMNLNKSMHLQIINIKVTITKVIQTRVRFRRESKRNSNLILLLFGSNLIKSFKIFGTWCKSIKIRSCICNFSFKTFQFFKNFFPLFLGFIQRQKNKCKTSKFANLIILREIRKIDVKELFALTFVYLN